MNNKCISYKFINSDPQRFFEIAVENKKFVIGHSGPIKDIKLPDSKETVQTLNSMKLT